MTRVAVRLQLDVENRFDVAVITGDFDFLVSTDKLIIRMDVVIEEWLFPFGAGVATVALITTMLVVRVILQMARHARLVHFIIERIFGMAVATGQCGVFALKRKLSVARVFKTRVVPVARVVTGLALLTAAAVVRVVGCVTSVASGRRGRECSVLMAIQAGGFPMPAY